MSNEENEEWRRMNDQSWLLSLFSDSLTTLIIDDGDGNDDDDINHDDNDDGNNETFKEDVKYKTKMTVLAPAHTDTGVRVTEWGANPPHHLW